MSSAQTVELHDVATFIRGVTFKPTDLVPLSDSAVACMRTKNIQENLDTSDVWALPSTFRLAPNQVLRETDILISSANSAPLVGRACWVPRLPWPSTFGGFVTVLRRTTDDVDPRYLYWWWTSPLTQAKVRACSNQTTNIANLSTRRASGLRLTLPGLDRQRHIVDIVDQADTIRVKGHQTLTHVDVLIESIFLDMFGTLNQNKGNWTTVAALAAGGDSIRTGPFGSQLLHSEFQSEGTAVLGIDSVVSNEFRWVNSRCISEAKYQQLKRYTVRSGDVLITIMGTLGRCAVVPGSLPTAINTKHLRCITLDRQRCLPDFLRAYFLWHPTAQRYLHRTAKGAIMSGLNMQIIKALPVPVVPLDEQTRFVLRQRACEELRATLRSSFDAINELFAALRNGAFRGSL